MSPEKNPSFLPPLLCFFCSRLMNGEREPVSPGKKYHLSSFLLGEGKAESER